MTVTIDSEGGGPLLIPNIGDHVIFLRPKGDDDEGQIDGIVENRLFMYLAQGICSVNIVVTESDVDDGRLIKE
jgi:hypothetical protein